MHEQGAPAAADVEVLVARLHLHVLADRVELASLRVLERLALVAEHAARVDHRLAEEPVVEVVSAVVDVRDVAAVRLEAVRHVLPRNSRK